MHTVKNKLDQTNTTTNFLTCKTHIICLAALDAIYYIIILTIYQNACMYYTERSMTAFEILQYN